MLFERVWLKIIMINCVSQIKEMYFHSFSEKQVLTALTESNDKVQILRFL